MAHLLTLHPHRAWAVVRAWATFIGWHRRLAMARREVVRRTDVKHIYRFSIVVRYLCGWRKFNSMM